MRVVVIILFTLLLLLKSNAAAQCFYVYNGYGATMSSSPSIRLHSESSFSIGKLDFGMGYLYGLYNNSLYKNIREINATIGKHWVDKKNHYISGILLGVTSFRYGIVLNNNLYSANGAFINGYILCPIGKHIAIRFSDKIGFDVNSYNEIGFSLALGIFN